MPHETSVGLRSADAERPIAWKGQKVSEDDQEEFARPSRLEREDSVFLAMLFKLRLMHHGAYQVPSPSEYDDFAI